MHLFPNSTNEEFPYLTHSVALHALTTKDEDEIKACMPYLKNYYSHQHTMNIMNVAAYLLNFKTIIGSLNDNHLYLCDSSLKAPFFWFQQNSDSISQDEIFKLVVDDMDMLGQGYYLKMW